MLFLSKLKATCNIFLLNFFLCVLLFGFFFDIYVHDISTERNDKADANWKISEIQTRSEKMRKTEKSPNSTWFSKLLSFYSYVYSIMGICNLVGTNYRADAGPFTVRVEMETLFNLTSVDRITVHRTPPNGLYVQYYILSSAILNCHFFKMSSDLTGGTSNILWKGKKILVLYMKVRYFSSLI